MLLESFASYAAHQGTVRLPADVEHAAKRALIDWFAALLPAVATAPALQLRRAHASELGHGRSSLPGTQLTAFASTAAWINGSTSHAVEFDDIFRDAVYHPGCPTIAAALALAEDRESSGIALLNAITVGYEISTRIGAAIQPAHYRYFHTTGTVGCFGAASAGAVLIDPGSVATTLHSMATAATFASGLQQAFRSDAMTKALHAGHAAWVGVTAAQGGAAGVTGVADILEGDAGFGVALCASPDWRGVTDGLGEQFNITRVTQKNYGCCGHTFAAIDALLDLQREHKFTADDIHGITVSTYAVALDVAGIRDPKSAFEARFSLPYVLSHAAIYGTVRLAAFGPERLQDERVRGLIAKVELIADPGLTAEFPKQRAARVEVALKNGRVVSAFAPYRRGDPEAPLSDAELNDKFIELASPTIGDKATQALLDKLWHVDQVDSVAELKLTTLRQFA